MGKRAAHVRHEGRSKLFPRERVPVDASEERMGLDLVCTIGSETFRGILRHQPLHEVFRLGRDVDVALVPFNAAGQDVLEHLLRRLVMERRDSVEEFVGDDTQRPL